MDFDGSFIMQKTVDWSLLNDGMTIPVSACTLLKHWDESILTHGVSKDIKVLINEFTKNGYHRKATIDKVKDGEITLN